MKIYQEKIIKPRVALLQLAEHLENMFQACKVMGYSRGNDRIRKISYAKEFILNWLGLNFELQI